MLIGGTRVALGTGLGLLMAGKLSGRPDRCGLGAAGGRRFKHGADCHWCTWQVAGCAAALMFPGGRIRHLFRSVRSCSDGGENRVGDAGGFGGGADVVDADDVGSGEDGGYGGGEGGVFGAR